MKKSFHLVLWILETSKTPMYDSFYDYTKLKYGNKVQ